MKKLRENKMKDQLICRESRSTMFKSLRIRKSSNQLSLPQKKNLQDRHLEEVG